MASQRFSPESARTSHEIVDAAGQRVGFYGNKSAASRALNSVRRAFNAGDKGAVQLGKDPNTFTIRPVPVQPWHSIQED